MTTFYKNCTCRWPSRIGETLSPIHDDSCILPDSRFDLIPSCIHCDTEWIAVPSGGTPEENLRALINRTIPTSDLEWPGDGEVVSRIVTNIIRFLGITDELIEDFHAELCGRECGQEFWFCAPCEVKDILKTLYEARQG